MPSFSCHISAWNCTSSFGMVMKATAFLPHLYFISAWRVRRLSQDLKVIFLIDKAILRSGFPTHLLCSPGHCSISFNLNGQFPSKYLSCLRLQIKVKTMRKWILGRHWWVGLQLHLFPQNCRHLVFRCQPFHLKSLFTIMNANLATSKTLLWNQMTCF